MFLQGQEDITELGLKGFEGFYKAAKTSLLGLRARPRGLSEFLVSRAQQCSAGRASVGICCSLQGSACGVFRLEWMNEYDA